MVLIQMHFKIKFMKFIIVLVLVTFSSVCFAQKDDKSKPKVDIPVAVPVYTDSTGLLSIKDVQILAKFLEDKMLAKDYNLVIGSLNQLLSERAKEYQKPKNK